MNYGFIYCMRSESMPGLYKIGQTERPPSYRCDELSRSTSAPTPFEILLYAEVSSPRECERLAHAHFSAYRINDSREFFALPDLKAFYEFLQSLSPLVMLSHQAEFEIFVEPEIAA